MKVVRRILTALAMATIAAVGLRLGGSGGSPPQRGGWRPLELPPDGADPTDRTVSGVEH